MTFCSGDLVPDRTTQADSENGQGVPPWYPGPQWSSIPAAIEAEREYYLIEMCLKGKRDAYQDGKEETLIRIILNHLPAEYEYDAAVKSVRDLSRLRKYGEEGDIHQIINLEDNSRLNYSADWLPDYMELRAELINVYQLAKRRRDESGRGEKKTVGHPKTMPILDGFAQPRMTA